MRELLVALLIAAVAMPAVAADANDATSFACVPDFATGFRLSRDGKWAPSQFSVLGKKYLLEKRGARWYWSEVGLPPDSKQESCEAFNEYGFTDCRNAEGNMTFNRRTLRFQLVRPYGYVTSDLATDKEITNAPPYFIIGKCFVQ